jgi:hypothetical protein
VGITSTGYRIVLVLHIFCAIVGFGAVYLNAIYGNEIKKRRGTDALAIYEANYKVSHIGEFFIYGVFVFGLALVGLSDKTWKFDQTWVWLAIVLYLIAVGLSHAILLPSVRKMGVLMREMVNAGPPPAGSAGPPPQAAQMAVLGKKVGMTGAALDVMMVVILCVMVWKPGA